MYRIFAIVIVMAFALGYGVASSWGGYGHWYTCGGGAIPCQVGATCTKTLTKGGKTVTVVCTQTGAGTMAICKNAGCLSWCNGKTGKCTCTIPTGTVFKCPPASGSAYC